MNNARKTLLAGLAVCALVAGGCKPPSAPRTSDSNSTDVSINPAIDSPTIEIGPGSDNGVANVPGEPSAAGTGDSTQVEPLAPSGAAASGTNVAAAPSTSSATNQVKPISVMLGSPELTAGIPGSGELTVEQIMAWLDNPENHAPIEPLLPMGIDAAAANITIPADNPMTKAKIELGRQLYFDPRLSSDGTISCASCHHPDEGYARRTRFGVGVRGQQGGRNSPVSYNRILSGAQFWDGRAASLEEQAAGPIANPIEMANTHEAALETIRKIDGYVMEFNKIFPAEGITIDTVTKAIATFERAIVTGPAPFDYYEYVRRIEQTWGADADALQALKDEEPEVFAKYQSAKEATQGLSEAAIKGRDLFFSERVGCTACHAGANFTDEKYHNLGVGMEAAKPDLGRSEISKQDADIGAFKTPSLRNVAQSAPYMHDGSQQTLMEVVEWYAKGGHPNDHLSDKVKKFDATEEEKKALVAFMEEALTGEFPKVERDRVPK
jgi:cytochrome c peroxidase